MDEDLIRISCGRKWPVSFVASVGDRYYVLLGDNGRELRPVRLLRVGDIVEGRGMITAMDPLASQGSA